MDELDELEERARTETVCRGCNGEKETGLIVCWNCWSVREDIIPFKYFGVVYAMPAPRAGNTSLNNNPISCCPAGVDQSCAISAMSVLVAVSTTPASRIR